jgi:phosphoribosylaminoimidazole-succinocarboxamide synthase
MPLATAGKEYPGSLQLPTGKKIRYKTIAEDFTELNRFFLEYIASFNIPVALQGKVDDKTLLFAEAIPYQFLVKISNHLDPRTSAAFNKPAWEQYPIPVIEYTLSEPGYEPALQNQIISLGLAPVEELKFMNRLCTKINAVMKSFFERRDAALISFCCQFGKSEDKIILTGEFTPPCIRAIPNAELPTAGENFFQFEDAAQLKKYVEFLLGAIKA